MDNRTRAAMIRKVERKIKAKYRKRCLWCFLIALVIGLVLGFVLCWKWLPREAQTSTLVDSLSTKSPVSDDSEYAPTPTPLPTLMVSADPTQQSPLSAPVETQPVQTVEATAVPTQPVQSEEEILAAYFGLPADDLGLQEDPTAQPASTDAVQEVATPTPQAADVVTQSDATQSDATQTDSTQTDSTQAVQSAPEAASNDPNAKGGINNPYLLDEVFTFETQVLPNGTYRASASQTEYITQRVSVSLKNYLTPEYYQENYSNRFRLTGTEAGAQLTISVDASSQAAFQPQQALTISFEDANGTVNNGFILMEEAVSSNTDIAIEPGESMTVYKRFTYNAEEEPDFLVVTYYRDGQAYKAYFKLEVAVPEVVYDTLSSGSRGDAVKALQERLVELGYLDDTADGIFGENTRKAISAAQSQAGMSVTGIADNDFQQYIFSAEAQSKQS